MTTFNGQTTPETITGTAFNDTINSSAGADTLIGGDGSDYINDTDGANVIYGDQTDVNAVAGGNDTLIGGISNQLYGGAGNDLISATGSSSLNGGAGNDTLDGGTNTNLLVGGAGNDVISGTGIIYTDSQGDVTRIGGDRVNLGLTIAQTYGVYDIKDFKAGTGGDVLVMHQLLADLIPAGFDYRNPLMDLNLFNADGSRVVDSTGSWMRLVQNGADTEIQVDANGPGNGSAYSTVIVLRGVTVSTLVTGNFESAFALDGSVVNSTVTGKGRIITLDMAMTPSSPHWVATRSMAAQATTVSPAVPTVAAFSTVKRASTKSTWVRAVAPATAALVMIHWSVWPAWTPCMAMPAQTP
jgi:hypothetical protein